MLCWQKLDMMIDAYTQEFKACIEICEVVGSGIGPSNPSTKLACVVAGKDYDRLKRLVNGDKIAIQKKMDVNR